MKLILTQNVPKLGALGAVINARDGYARNYLLPRGIALEYTPQNMKIVGEKTKKSELQNSKQKEAAQALAEKLANYSCTIAVKIIEEDRLFGSVTEDMIQKALAQDDIAVDKNAVIMDEHIKKLGVYQISLKLHPEVSADIKVWVVKE